MTQSRTATHIVLPRKKTLSVLTEIVVDQIFGYDFFISYTRRDGAVYASALAGELKARGFRCFLDKSDFGAGDPLGGATHRALKKTNVLILVGSPQVHESEFVRIEIDQSNKLNRKIIPIDIGKTLENLTTEYELRSLLADRIRINEKADALTIGPSNEVLGSLLESFKSTRQETKRVRILAAGTFVFAIVAAVAVFFAWQANASAKIAQEQRQIADGQRIEAENQTRIAVEERKKADEQRQIADDQRIEANRARDRAEHQTQIAQRERRNAVYQGQVASSNLASTRYTLSNVESEEHAEPAKALLLASSALQAAPGVDPLLDVYARRAEMLALASSRYVKATDRAEIGIFSPGLDKVATFNEGRVRITDLRSGEPIHVPSLTEPFATVASFTIPAFSPDGSYLVAGTSHTSARCWRLKDGSSRSVTTPEVIVRGTLQSMFYFSPDGHSALGWVGVETGDFDGQHVQAAWDVESGQPASTVALPDVFRLGQLSWSRNSTRNWGVIFTHEGRLQVVNVSTGAPVSPEFGPDTEKGQVVALALSPNADWLVTETHREQENTFELELWSARDGKPVNVAPMRSSERLEIEDVSADGKKILAVASRTDATASLQLWEFGVSSYPLHYRELGSVPGSKSLWAKVWGRGRLAVFCGETRLIAAVSADPTAWTGRGPQFKDRFSIRLWHTETGQELSRSIRSTGGLIAWSLSPDEREIATMTADGVVTITDLYWDRPVDSAPSTAARDSSRLPKTDRTWFGEGLNTVVTATTEGISYVGGMATSDGQPKLLLQHWRLPEFKPLWPQPVVLTGDPMRLTAAVLAFSKDGRQMAIGAEDVRLFDAGSGVELRPPLAMQGRVVGLSFAPDGKRLALASETTDNQGNSMFRIEQRDLGSSNEVNDTRIEWPYYVDGAARVSGFAGFTANGQHFLRVFVSEHFGGDWSLVRRLELVDLRNGVKLRLDFSRESPAPPALIAAVIRTALDFEPISSEEVIARLPAARIRIRAVREGALLEHLEAHRAIVAPPPLSRASLAPALSADARWIGIATPSGREIQIWSAFTGMPSSEPILRQTELVAMSFDKATQHLWHIGRDGSPQLSYIGTNRSSKPHWLATAAEAITGIRLTGQGVRIEWIDDQSRRTAWEELLRSLSNEATNGDPGAVRIKARLDRIVGNQ